jgi:hypothetical protein
MSSEYGPEEMALLAARNISGKYAGMASIDTADDFEAAFIFAAIELSMDDPGVAARIGRLMREPRIMQALWRKDSE